LALANMLKVHDNILQRKTKKIESQKKKKK